MESSTTKLQYRFIIALAAWLFLSTTVLTILTFSNPVLRATIGMGWGLIIFWIAIGGGLMRRFRDPVKKFVTEIPLNWKIKFVLFSTLLALIEEAVTTTMTNLAPLFGVKIGQAYITASTNYFDVIAFHSVIVFIPLFIAWAFILSKFDFSPFAAFLLFGITGTFGEMLFGGFQHITEFGLWIFVYGLMMYLPAYSIPEDRGARRPKPWHYAAVIPLAYAIALPFLLVIGYVVNVILHHPRVHF